MMLVKLTDHPEIRRIILAASPTYKKHQASVSAYPTVRLSGTYWDGGSRSTYVAVRLSDCFSLGAPQFDPPQFGGPRVDPVVEVPEGVAIVCVGTFCGKTATASVTLNPANMAKLLT
jgi:hypothetical protein